MSIVFGSSRRRRGFTLVELLVVIAIIGVLVALLLPAVQAAREAARRMQCTNNQKQLVLASHNFHDTFNRLPPGSAMDQSPFGTTPAGASWGSSWLVYILPFIEQGNLHDKWQFSGSSGYANANNKAIAEGVIIKGYTCPSSPMDILSRTPNGATQGTTKKMASSYVGISGAVNGIIPNYSETRFDTGSSGIAGGSGAMVPNGQFSMAALSDGTSNTMIIGEVSNYLYKVNGTKVDFRPSAQYGWMMGARYTTTPPDWTVSSNDNRTFNLMTVRYPINKIKDWPNTDDGTNLGIAANNANNIPLNSPHPGGCVVGLADGSVRFLSQATPLDMVARLATRDDGQAINID